MRMFDDLNWTSYNTLQVFKTLVDKTKEVVGAKVENHKFCASVHYRNVDENVSLISLLFLLVS